jgi:uncharacterized protein YdhG (YjbR/CyaY superfamily)
LGVTTPRAGAGAKDSGQPPPAAIDAYLASLPADQRAALEQLRATIAAAAPAAEEGFSYSAPAFRYRGRPLVAYLAAKGHCSFFPMNPAVQDAHRAALAGFSMSKGTIHFSPDRPIPAEVVTSIVRARLAEIDGRS